MPASTELFKRYPNKWFVETGSYKGDGIQCAIDAGFDGIMTVELSRELYYKCQKRFPKGATKCPIDFYLGDSGKTLECMLINLYHIMKGSVTFWLDSHYSEGCTAKGDEMSPILKELAIIANHPIKTHTILIDDVRQFGTRHFGFIRENQIVEALRKINPDYKLTYDTGDKKFPHDVLVARV